MQVMDTEPSMTDVASSMKCIRFDVCKAVRDDNHVQTRSSSMKCIRFDVCKLDTDGNMHIALAPQ